MRVLPRVKRRWRWLAAFIFLLWLAVLAADRLWPLPLQDVTPARVVVAEDGTPLWRFADTQGDEMAIKPAYPGRVHCITRFCMP